jgi:hypothetical protein
LTIDALVIACYSCRLVLDLPLHILKFRKPSIGDMVELGPFWLCSYCGWCVSFGGIIISWDVDELENKWSSSDDSTATGQKVSADDIFQDR